MRRWLAALAIAGAVAPASGATLQISPVTVEMAAGNPAAGVTLSNPGARPIYGQVRTFRWTQEHGDDVLAHAPDSSRARRCCRSAGKASSSCGSCGSRTASRPARKAIAC